MRYKKKLIMLKQKSFEISIERCWICNHIFEENEEFGYKGGHKLCIACHKSLTK